VLTAIALLDLLTAERVVLISLLILGPLIASAYLDAPATAVVSGYAVALGVALGAANHIFGTSDHLVRCLVILAAGAVATWLAGRRSAREAKLRRVTRVAEVAQRAILRTLPPRVGPIDVAARYVSAAQEALIGGDLYEVAATPYGVRVVVGDVRGKGLDAVRLAAVVLGAFREAAYAHPDLGAAADAMATSVARELEAEEFVTMVLAQFGAGGELELVNCGHPAPMRYSHGQARLLQAIAPATPIGLEPEVAVQAFRLEPGDRVLLYTDGLLEARDALGRFFPFQEGASAWPAGAALDAALEQLVEQVRRHAGGRLEDDLALLLAEYRSRETDDQDHLDRIAAGTVA
jgi:serine phosphatase RsbU (regulator of sigma subunit)